MTNTTASKFTFHSKVKNISDESSKIPQAIFQVSHPINHPSHHLELLFHHLLSLKSHRQTESQKIYLLSLNLYLKLNRKEYQLLMKIFFTSMILQEHLQLICEIYVKSFC